MRVTVLGLGRSGVSAAMYLKRRGAEVFLSEGNSADEDKLKEVERLKEAGIRVELGNHSDEALNSADLVVVSPGIAPESDVITRLRAIGKEIICDIELAFREAKMPFIGITGTNGKSTTSALVSHILSSAGYKAPACGNIGVPILDELEKNPDFLVAEISSYQLHYCNTLSPYVAVWLNLTPDHIEWHGNLQNYMEAKQKLFACQKSNQFAVLNEDDPIVSEFEPASELFSFSVDSDMDYAVQGAFMKGGYLCYRMDGATHLLVHQDELKIIGKHNLENALAAVSVAAVLGVDEEKIGDALKSFPGLEHRLEFVATINGIKFYNDSKATNPNSTIKALEAFGSQPVVLIAGGKDKMTALGDLCQTAKTHASVVILLGEARERFHRTFKENGYYSLHQVDTIEEALNLALTIGKGPVVLSPACASFDQFKNFEERGRVFKDLVRARATKLAPSI